ncbi:hypothetical protein, partial [Rhodococcus wratislaviensis]|uniref:hypothetical protein n=1 Tax=Rhodococcus wratislaviensis TaxID=44752 RepID=UPI00364F4FE0
GAADRVAALGATPRAQHAPAGGRYQDTIAAAVRASLSGRVFSYPTGAQAAPFSPDDPHRSTAVDAVTLPFSHDRQSLPAK